jgi:hypothetical protein
MPHSGGVRPSSKSRALPVVLALVAVLAGGAKCEATGLPSDDGSSTGQGASGPGSAADASQQLASLKVAPKGSTSGYSRDRFPHWISQGGGCDTRDVVLKRDGQNVKATSTCKITSGTWTSPYDNKTYTDPQKLDVDHMVPLADAWRSGANAWNDDKRSQFANDLVRPQLLAVSLSENRSKGDQDPSTWKPPNQSYWCTYAERWIAVKVYWQLTVSQAEQGALQSMLATCR